MRPEAFLASLINYERIAKPDYNFKLDNFRRFLKSIGNPHKKLKNVILIAGTKGKGSTAIYIESCLHVCGLKTALYTSPHLLSLQERIKVNNLPLSKKDLYRLINKIKPQAEKFQITFFEAMTAIAFLYFLEKKVDYTVLEVGLGGRLDATNVTHPKVAVITRIGYDHINILGKTLGKIAYEKAGIIHPKSFVVISKQKSQALKVIKKKIRQTKNNYYDTQEKLQAKAIVNNLSGSQFTLWENRRNLGRFDLKNLGKHQIENAVTAWSVLHYLQKYDPHINDNGIKNGLASAQIQARCQAISQKPLIIIDSAHNPESAHSLSNIIRHIIKQKPIIVYGSSQGKLVNKILNILAPVVQQLVLTRSQNPRHIPIDKLAKLCQHKSIPYQSADSVKQAIRLAKRTSKNKIPIIITGSFYIAGEAIEYFQK